MLLPSPVIHMPVIHWPITIQIEGKKRTKNKTCTYITSVSIVKEFNC